MWSTCKSHYFMATMHQLMNMLECWSSSSSKKSTFQSISVHSSSLPYPTMRPSPDPNYSLTYHFRDERMNIKECVPPVGRYSYYFPQLISNWNKNKEVIPWNKEIWERWQQAQELRKAIHAQKALKIHKFSFNATKIAQRRVQFSASWKRETTIVSLVQKRIPLCQH